MPMSDSAPLHSIGLLLTPGFALMSYASVLEPFRAANVLSRQKLYEWHHVSVDGSPVLGSHGGAMIVDASIGEDRRYDTIFVFAGGDPFAIDDRDIFAWLRAEARKEVRIAGVSGGPVLLARAGLLDGHRATIHWEHRTLFVETFHRVAVEAGLYVIDRKRMTCAGGVAGLDFGIDLIERDHGGTLASKVSEWFIRTDPRRADRPQRMALRERYGVNDDRVVRVLAEMEAHLEEPRRRDVLARAAGVSMRQLERLFQTEMGRSIDKVYSEIRLDQAMQLLRATGMSITEIGVACGFKSGSHFSRAFLERHGSSPRAARMDMRRRAEVEAALVVD